MPELIVELYGQRLGALQGDWRTFDFVMNPEAVQHFGIDSPILSTAVPLTAVPARARKDRRRNFFQELLPEGRMLTRMAEDAGVSAQDSVGLLRHYGRDIAGALQIWDPEHAGEPRSPRLEPLNARGVAELLVSVSNNPLGNRPITGKTSLAGVQDKIVLARTGSGWNRVLDGFASTHILKPAASSYPTTIYDEEYGSRLARALGLADFNTWIDDFDGVPALVIERYDRSTSAPFDRIHQEDFNQALGASGNQKYQKYGGRVSLKRIAGVLGTLRNNDGVTRLLRATVLAVAIGNVDMHAKNLALVHPFQGRATLAPLYDVVPQSHHDGFGEMALAVNSQYQHRELTAADIAAEARTWGIADPEPLIHEALRGILATVATETPHPDAHPRLVEDIARYTTNLVEGRPVSGKNR